MDILLAVLRFIAFILSILGYTVFVRIIWRIPQNFSYLFVLCLLSCILFFAGLLNVLLYASYAVFGLGILLFILFAVLKKLPLLFNLKTFTILNVVFGIALGIIIVSLIDTRFVHYDNFSHWGVVVKDMLSTNAFPTASSEMIDFKNYPLGTSTFLYYFCRIAGSTEGNMLIGQSFLIFACFYAMFGVIRDKKRLLLISLLALCFAAMTYFNISIRINNLLVDFLIPLLALAAITVMFANRYDFLKACIISAPILAFLVIVKNNAIFFAAMAYFYLIYLAFHTKKLRVSSKRWLLLLACIVVIAVSLTTFYAWNIHTTLAFKGETSKFSISTENISSVYGAKTPEQVSAIIKSYLAAIFSLESLATLGIAGFTALALIAYLIARVGFKKKWQLLKVLIVLDITVALYYAGILAMFIYTMPLDEALRLAGFERYASSIVLFLIGGLALCAVSDTEKSFHIKQGEKRNYMAFKSLFTKNIYQYATMICITASAILLLSEINGMNSMKADYPASLPAKVESVTGNNWTNINNKKYLFYATDTDRQISDYYLQYAGRYLLYAPHVDAVNTFESGALIQKLREYDYFVIIESDKAITDFMRVHAKSEGQPGIYSTSEIS